MSWFQQQWNRFAGSDEHDAPIRHLEVAWGRERLNVPVKEQTRGQTTLRDLKGIISQLTGVPYEQVKLIHHGLILKDDKLPLAAYNLHTGSRLGLVGTQGGATMTGDKPGAKTSIFDSQDGEAYYGKTGKRKSGGGSGASGSARAGPSKGEEIAQRRKERENDTSEAGLLSRIDEAVQGVHADVVPELEVFEKSARGAGASREGIAPHPSDGQHAHSETPAGPAATQEALGKQHRKLSELLLRALLALDGIAVSSETTRTRRKEAVKEVQMYLDRVDAAWASIKERFAKGVKSTGSTAAAESGPAAGRM